VCQIQFFCAYSSQNPLFENAVCTSKTVFGLPSFDSFISMNNWMLGFGAVAEPLSDPQQFRNSPGRAH
jgi:hypothetical protein